MRTNSSPLRALLESAGAKWIELPVLHPAEPFLETAGEDIRRRMFVTEGAAGERLALRPDFTIPVCLAHLASGAAEARYAYQGTVFRRHDSGSPERLETGYEDIGRAGEAKADAEALALGVAAVAMAAAGALTVRLGDIALFAALLDALRLPAAWQRKLRRSFGVPALMQANLARLAAPRAQEDARLDARFRSAAEKHDRAGLAGLLAGELAAHGHFAGAGRAPEEIAERFLDQRALAEAHLDAAAAATLDAFLTLSTSLAEAEQALQAFCKARSVDLGSALSAFAERAREIATLDPAAHIRFEAGFGRPLDYYSGLVFDIRAEGVPFPVAGGGRYDRLTRMLGAGRDVPAVGFTMRLDLPVREGWA